MTEEALPEELIADIMLEAEPLFAVEAEVLLLFAKAGCPDELIKVMAEVLSEDPEVAVPVGDNGIDIVLVIEETVAIDEAFDN